MKSTPYSIGLLLAIVTITGTAASRAVPFTASTGDTIVQTDTGTGSASVTEEIEDSSGSSESSTSFDASASSSIEAIEEGEAIEDSSESSVSSSDASSQQSSRIRVRAPSASSESFESSNSFTSSDSSKSSDSSVSSESSESSGSSESSVFSESSTSSTSSRDRLEELKGLVIDRKAKKAMSENIAPSFVVPPHSDISNADELRTRLTMTLVSVAGASTEQEFTVASESGAYRVTLNPPRTFTPGRYRLIAELDRTRGVSRTLQRFFRLTDASSEQGNLTLIDEYIDWGLHPINPDEPQNDRLVLFQRHAPSQVKPGTTETMHINVTVAADMTAVIRETVPAGFTISDVSPAASVTVVGDAQRIEWSGMMEKEIARTFSYSVTAGSQTPLFTLFGPVEIRGTPQEDLANMEQLEVVEVELSPSSSSSIEATEEDDAIEEIQDSSESSASSGSLVPSASSASSAFSDFLTSEAIEEIEAIEDSSTSSEPSNSSESSGSSESSESSDSVLQSFLSSFFRGIASLIGSVTFDDDEMSFSEDRRWQMLITQEEDFAGAVRERVLMLERSAAVFDANSAPSFTLVETDLVADATNVNGSGHLLSVVAVQEILGSIITESQVQDAVVKKILTDEAGAIASQKLDNRTSRQELQDVAPDASALALQETVTDAIARDGSGRNELAEIVNDNALANEIVEEIVDTDVTDAIVQKIAANGTKYVDLNQAISDTLAADSDSTEALRETVVGTVLADSQSTDVIRASVSDTDESAAVVELSQPVIRVNLTGPDGSIMENVPFHFTVGSVVLVIDPLPAFRPGLYTVEVLVTNPLTGEVTPMYQQFAWGVLAMNSDKDRYVTGETARIDVGVLDDFGEIVCIADLDLEITSPDGSIERLSTDDDSIETTGTCGKKEAGFIEPDFTTQIEFAQAGTYTLTLTAETPNGVRSIESTIVVDTTSSFSIKRTAATRLWPFAASSMDIDVAFGADVDGMISERVPPGFEILETEPESDILELDDGTQFIRWTGEWNEGDIESFRYIYDAPDISPQFYLLGPIRILSDSPIFVQ